MTDEMNSFLSINNSNFNSTWTVNFQMFMLDLEKAEEPEIKLSTCTGSQKKQVNSRKTSTSASLTTLNLLYAEYIMQNAGLDEAQAGI